MFVGKSPEELELAGEEEVGFSLSDLWEKTKQVAIPVGRVFFPQFTAAATGLQSLAKKGAQVPGKVAAVPAKLIKPGAKAATPGAPSAPATPVAHTSAAPSKSATSGYYSIMGADPPMTDAEVIAHINREPNPLKRARMIENYRNARSRRSRYGR